jgi:hypothetical protein
MESLKSTLLISSPGKLHNHTKAEGTRHKLNQFPAYTFCFTLNLEPQTSTLEPETSNVKQP